MVEKKNPIVTVTYENERILIRNSLPYSGPVYIKVGEPR